MARASRIPGDRELHAAQQHLLTIGFVGSLFGVALVAVFGDDLLALLYGEPFRAAGLAFTLLASIVPLRLVAYLNEEQLGLAWLPPDPGVADGADRVFAAIAGAIAIDLYDYDGAAAVTLASEALLALLYMDAVRRRVGSEFVLYPVGLRRAVA